MFQRTITIAIFLVMTFGTSSAQALLVSTKPAWNGWVRAGMPTEVAIRVVGDRAGELTLTLKDGPISYIQKTKLEPKVEFVWRVPLSAPSGLPIQLSAQLDEEPGIEQEIIFRRHLAPSPLVAVLVDQPLPLDSIEATTIYLSPDSLPFHNSSFTAMDLIVIQQDSLKGMARQQMIALRQHAAQCGRIIVIGFAPATMTSFAKLAGCGGNFLVATESAVDINTRVASLLSAPVTQLPSPSSLQGLLDNNGMVGQTRPMIIFFTIYLCVLLIALRSQRARFYFVIASTTACLVGLIVWTMNPEHIDRVVWTEMDGSAGVARYKSILRVLGGGGVATIEIPDNARTLRALQTMNLVIMSAQNSDGAASVRFDSPLYSQHEFVVSGVTRMPVPLVVEYSDEGPRITNTGTGKSSPALLSWNDARYSVPALAPDQNWQPSSEQEPWGSSRVEQLFRQRAMLESTALLFEYPPNGQQETDTTRSYLMVRP